MTKQFFQKNQIEYTELDVAKDADARNEMISKSGQFGVPVVDVDGQLVIGFDRERLTKLLGVGVPS